MGKREDAWVGGRVGERVGVKEYKWVKGREGEWVRGREDEWLGVGREAGWVGRWEGARTG